MGISLIERDCGKAAVPLKMKGLWHREARGPAPSRWRDWGLGIGEHGTRRDASRSFWWVAMIGPLEGRRIRDVFVFWWRVFFRFWANEPKAWRRRRQCEGSKHRFEIISGGWDRTSVTNRRGW